MDFMTSTSTHSPSQLFFDTTLCEVEMVSPTTPNPKVPHPWGAWLVMWHIAQYHKSPLFWVSYGSSGIPITKSSFLYTAASNSPI